jgi:Flp pilus assembly protein TadD
VNSLGALGKEETLRNVQQRRVVTFETHLKNVPEDPRACMYLAGLYASLGRVEDAVRETNLTITLRGNEATVLYNTACVFCLLNEEAGGSGRVAESVGGRV